MYEKGRYSFLEICSYSWGTVCSNSLEKLSLQWYQQGSPSKVLLWVLVKVSVDNVAVVGELNPNHEEADRRMLVHTYID